MQSDVCAGSGSVNRTWDPSTILHRHYIIQYVFIGSCGPLREKSLGAPILAHRGHALAPSNYNIQMILLIRDK